MITQEQENTIEDCLREAQSKIEEAARLLCSEPGDSVGGEMYRTCYKMAENMIPELIHNAYKLVLES